MGGVKCKKGVGSFLWHSCRVRVRVRVGRKMRVENRKMRGDQWGLYALFFVKTHIPVLRLKRKGNGMVRVRWRCSALAEFQCSFQFNSIQLGDQGFSCLDFLYDLIS